MTLGKVTTQVGNCTGLELFFQMPHSIFCPLYSIVLYLVTSQPVLSSVGHKLLQRINSLLWLNFLSVTISLAHCWQLLFNWVLHLSHVPRKH